MGGIHILDLTRVQNIRQGESAGALTVRHDRPRSGGRAISMLEYGPFSFTESFFPAESRQTRPSVDWRFDIVAVIDFEDKTTRWFPPTVQRTVFWVRLWTDIVRMGQP